MIVSIGLMSGTSMDGIDVAMLETDGQGHIKELGHTSLSYAHPFKILLKAAEYAVRQCEGDLNRARAYYPRAIVDYLSGELKMSTTCLNHKLTQLTAYLHGEHAVTDAIHLDQVIQHSTQLHASAVQKLLQMTAYTPSQIDVVGYHGQTLFHRPSIGKTVQVGDGQALAEQLGIAVVNDFRRRDVAAGGQGAPFAPIYHQALAIRDNKIPVAVVNCGGIANMTLINSANESDLIGFDTGPGNGLIDRLIRQRTNGEEDMDADGKYGKQGTVNYTLLDMLYKKAIIKEGKNYFASYPPKSLDYGDMTLIPELDAAQLPLEDACKTLEAFTADTIVQSLKLSTTTLPEHWILAGGGWKNPVIREELEQRLQQKIGDTVTVQTADDAGWHSQALEAQIFAYLAVRSLKNLPISVPGTTRVPQPLSGGHAYMPSGGGTEVVTALCRLNPSVLNGYR